MTTLSFSGVVRQVAFRREPDIPAEDPRQGITLGAAFEAVIKVEVPGLDSGIVDLIVSDAAALADLESHEVWVEPAIDEASGIHTSPKRSGGNTLDGKPLSITVSI